MSERGSDKHGPFMDDELERESQGIVRGGGPTRSDEFHEPEPAHPDPDEAPHRDPRAGGTPPDMGVNDVALRSELATTIQGLRFPARRDDLLPRLESVGASDELVERVERLPAEREYTDLGDLTRALGIATEGHRF